MIESRRFVNGLDVDLSRIEAKKLILMTAEDQAKELLEARAKIDGKGGEFRIHLSWRSDEEIAELGKKKSTPP